MLTEKHLQMARPGAVIRLKKRSYSDRINYGAKWKNPDDVAAWCKKPYRSMNTFKKLYEIPRKCTANIHTGRYGGFFILTDIIRTHKWDGRWAEAFAITTVKNFELQLPGGLDLIYHIKRGKGYNRFEEPTSVCLVKHDIEYVYFLGEDIPMKRVTGLFLDPINWIIERDLNIDEPIKKKEE